MSWIASCPFGGSWLLTSPPGQCWGKDHTCPALKHACGYVSKQASCMQRVILVVSTAQQRESAVRIHISLLFEWISFPRRSCLKNPMDRGAWWAAVHGVTEDRTQLSSLSLFTFMHWRRKWQPTTVSLPGESQGRGAWWAAVYGVAQSRT